jgi:hypothetical protein
MMLKWEYLTMTVMASGDYGEDKTIMHLNGKEVLVGIDFFGKQYPSFYERIYSAGQEGWELAGIEYGIEKNCATYIFKRLIPSS